MKTLFRISILLSFLLLTNDMWSNNPMPLKSKVEKVTVYQNGAVVEREGKTSIPAGRSIIIFKDLPSNLQPASIQFTAQGDFTILSIQHQLNYLTPPKPDAAIAQLNKRSKKTKFELEREKALLSSYQEEESLLLSNKQVGSSENGVDIQQLAAAADLYRTRIKEIRLAKLDISQKIGVLQDTINQIQNQLNQLNAQGPNKSVSEVLITVDATRTISSNFKLSYMISGASWTPLYDLRVKDTQQPLALGYKAKVYQQTGEDWKGVKLILSTGNPSSYSQPPVLNPWWLDFYQGYSRPQIQRQQKENLEYDMEDALSAPRAPSASPPPVVATDQSTSFRFEIQVPYDIPSDGQNYVVSIGQYELPASYQYYCAPKISPFAYLTAQITGWEDYRLLPGEANLFFEGTYLGRTSLNPNVATDTMQLSLGKDEGIAISRKKGKQYAEKQFIGNKQIKTIAWDIQVRNNKRREIKMLIEDQFPVSTNEAIEVSLGKLKGAEVVESKGLIRWELNLKAGKSKTLSHSYEVKYPKNSQLYLE
jgi:uncharacterized protein (TIGR02231 family)